MLDHVLPSGSESNGSSDSLITHMEIKNEPPEVFVRVTDDVIAGLSRVGYGTQATARDLWNHAGSVLKQTAEQAGKESVDLTLMSTFRRMIINLLVGLRFRRSA